jgi:hypothetical protein
MSDIDIGTLPKPNAQDNWFHDTWASFQGGVSDNLHLPSLLILMQPSFW